MGRRTLLVFTAILFLAAFLRFFLLHEIPPGLYPDEAANGVDALRAAHAGDFRVFYPDNNGREGLFINLQALAIQAFGPSAWTLRAASAAAGTLTVFFFFFLAREIGVLLFRSRRAGDVEESVASPSGHGSSETRERGRASSIVSRAGGNDASFRGGYGASEEAYALLATFLLAVSFWHITFSRIGFRAILLPLFASAALFFLLRGMRTRAAGDFLVSGFAFGISLSTYIASRVLPLLALPFLFRDARSVGINRALLCRWGFFAAAFLIAFAPLAGYFIAHPADFVGRADDVSVFSADDPLRALLVSTGKTLLMFHVTGDGNWRHNIAGRPQLDPLTGTFFFIGIAIAVVSLRRSSPCRWIAALLLLWFAFGLLPAVTTVEGMPHALRTLGALPAAILLSAWGAMALWQRLRKSRIRALRGFLATTFTSVILLTNFHAYFLVWGGSADVAGAFRSDLTAIAGFLNSHSDTERFVIVNEGGALLDGVPMPSATIRFLTGDDPAIRYVAPERVEEIAAVPGKTTIVSTLAPDEELDRSLRTLFPTVERIEETGVVFYRL